MSNEAVVRAFLKGMQSPISQVPEHLRRSMTTDAEWGNSGFPPCVGIDDIISKHEMSGEVFGDYVLTAEVLHIAEGADADLVIWSGDPLSTMSRAERVFVDGREYFSIEKDKAHRERIASERERLIQKLMREQARLKKKQADGDGDVEGLDPKEDERQRQEDEPGRPGIYAWFYGQNGHAGAGASMCGACGVIPTEYLEMMEREAR